MQLTADSSQIPADNVKGKMRTGTKFGQKFKRVFFTWAGKCSCAYTNSSVGAQWCDVRSK